MTLNDFIGKKYEDGGRGPGRYDCWGLTRAVRHEVYGLPLLPSFGHVRNTMPLEFARAYKQGVKSLQTCGPVVGAVAAVFRGRLCVHVAVVVEINGDLAVMEINAKSNCRWTRVAEFERNHLRVEYYRD